MAFPLLISIALVGAQLRRGLEVVGEDENCRGGKTGINKACQEGLVCTEIVRNSPGAYWKCRQPKSTTAKPSMTVETVTTEAPCASLLTHSVCRKGKQCVWLYCLGINPDEACKETRAPGLCKEVPSTPETTTTKTPLTGLAVAGPGEHCQGGRTNFQKDCQEGYVCTNVDPNISHAFWVCKLGEPTTVAPSMTTTATGTTEAQCSTLLTHSACKVKSECNWEVARRCLGIVADKSCNYETDGQCIN